MAQVTKSVVLQAQQDVQVRTYVACPSCGYAHAFSVGHLPELRGFNAEDGITKRVGPWSCKECGVGYHIETKLDGNYTLTEAPGRDRFVPVWVLLRLYREVDFKPVYIVAEENAFINEAGEFTGNQKYFYGEHTCPWNWLRKTIIHGDDKDPHGLFIHQETIRRPTDDDLLKLGIEPEQRWDGKITPQELMYEDLQKLFSTLRDKEDDNDD